MKKTVTCASRGAPIGNEAVKSEGILKKLETVSTC